MNMKVKVGQEIAKRVKNGEILGVGTGSTVDAALTEIHKRVTAEGLNISVVPSSYETTMRCEEIGLNVLSPMYGKNISWGFDGADEVDPDLRLIKGRGGAMLQEKILARKCEKFVVIVDESKLVDKLCEKCAIPVEVVPQARYLVIDALKGLGASEISLREAVKKHGPVITEAGNFIIDVKFSKVSNSLEKELKSILGVVETGLFIDFADEVIVSSDSEIRSLTRS